MIIREKEVKTIQKEYVAFDESVFDTKTECEKYEKRQLSKCLYDIPHTYITFYIDDNTLVELCGFYIRNTKDVYIMQEYSHAFGYETELVGEYDIGTIVYFTEKVGQYEYVVREGNKDEILNKIKNRFVDEEEKMLIESCEQNELCYTRTSHTNRKLQVAKCPKPR